VSEHKSAHVANVRLARKTSVSLMNRDCNGADG